MEPKLSFLDRFLPLWILLAMALGLALGAWVPGLGDALGGAEVLGVSIPIAIGLLVMMYPPLAKVRYDRALNRAFDAKALVVSVVANWVLGPAVMFALAWAFLPDVPELRTGVIIVGLARCIAMVVVWTDLACSDRELTVVLVAINSIFQILMFSLMGWFYLQVLPGWLGLDTTSVNFSLAQITGSVLVFLGVPLLCAILSRRIGERTRGRDWYEQVFLPKISPLALWGLLFTITILFSLQGERFIAEPGTVARVAAPLLCYFVIMFLGTFFAARALGMNYERTSALAFTAAGNNFELAIAVCVGTFGTHSLQALAGTVGPLIEVPVLLGLVYVARYLRKVAFATRIEATN